MKKEVGLWIDHKKTVIFSLADEGAKIKRISSELEKNVLFSYYDEVVDYICDAESILIFGPGEAKNELKKRLESRKLHQRVVGFETAENMTDNQIVVKVRQRFLK